MSNVAEELYLQITRRRNDGTIKNTHMSAITEEKKVSKDDKEKKQR